jgi:hypothetical protein
MDGQSLLNSIRIALRDVSELRNKEDALEARRENVGLIYRKTGVEAGAFYGVINSQKQLRHATRK